MGARGQCGLLPSAGRTGATVSSVNTHWTRVLVATEQMSTSSCRVTLEPAHLSPPSAATDLEVISDCGTGCVIIDTSRRRETALLLPELASCIDCILLCARIWLGKSTADPVSRQMIGAMTIAASVERSCTYARSYTASARTGHTALTRWTSVDTQKATSRGSFCASRDPSKGDYT